WPLKKLNSSMSSMRMRAWASLNSLKFFRLRREGARVEALRCASQLNGDTFPRGFLPASGCGIPDLPRRVAGGPQIFQKLVLARRVHALPESLVTIGGQLAVAGALGQSVRFQNTVRITQIALDKFLFEDHEAAVDVARGRLRLFGEAGNQLIVQFNLAESTGWMDSGDRGQLAGSAVELEE